MPDLTGTKPGIPIRGVISFPVSYNQEELMPFSRRDFVKTSVLGAVAAGVGAPAQGEDAKLAVQEREAHSGSYKRPIIVCANNGFNYLEDAYAFLKSGGDTLDAALKVVKGPEDDPKDTSVGLGGLPNEEGVVELDACCMHGPTRRAGSVGGVRNIKNVSLVSKAVFEHTGHVMLVGEGAERFAVADGFPRENLLTDHSRKVRCCGRKFIPTRTGGDQASPTRTGSLPTQIPTNHNRNYGKSASRTFKPAPPNWASSPSCK